VFTLRITAPSISSSLAVFLGRCFTVLAFLERNDQPRGIRSNPEIELKITSDGTDLTKQS
jgi:hypothetical protein